MSEYCEKWDRRFLELARLVSSWSKDPSTKVGAVLVSPDKRVVGIGYNGFPVNVPDDERLEIRDLKNEIVVHAEVNAIIQAGSLAKGATLYTYPTFALPNVCCRCAGVAIQAGVAGIVSYQPNRLRVEERTDRWKASLSVAREMWEEAGCFVRSYPEVVE